MAKLWHAIVLRTEDMSFFQEERSHSALVFRGVSCDWRISSWIYSSLLSLAELMTAARSIFLGTLGSSLGSTGLLLPVRMTYSEGMSRSISLAYASSSSSEDD